MSLKLDPELDKKFECLNLKSMLREEITANTRH